MYAHIYSFSEFFRLLGMLMLRKPPPFLQGVAGIDIGKLITWCSQRSKPLQRCFCQKVDVVGTPCSQISIGVPKEIFPNELRVAVVPNAVQVTLC